MAHKAGLPLSKVKNFPGEYLDKLAALYVTTAEEFVSITNAQDRRDRMSSYLGIDKAKLDQLINMAKNLLPESVRKEMEMPVDTSKYGLGALEPETKKEKQESNLTQGGESEGSES